MTLPAPDNDSDSETFWRQVLSTVDDLDRRSYYELLGLPGDATSSAIRDRYYALVRRIHPDRHAREVDATRTQALVRLYARVGEAYRVLSSPERRRAYDDAQRSGKTRMAPSSSAKQQPAPAADPRMPHVQKLYQRGLELYQSGDRRGAKAQWSLAIQFEPTSKVLREALELLQAPAPGKAEPAAGSPLIDPIRELAADVELAAFASESSPIALIAISDSEALETDRATVSADAAGAEAADEAMAGALVAGDTLPGNGAELVAGAASGSRDSRATDTLPDVHTMVPDLPKRSRFGVQVRTAGPAEPAPAQSAGKQRRPVTVRCSTWDKVAAFYERKIRGGGLFVSTPYPPPLGALVPLVVQLPDDRLVALSGRVAELPVGDKPGMLLGFDTLSPEAATVFTNALMRLQAQSAREPRVATEPPMATDGLARDPLDALAEAVARDPRDARARAAYYMALSRQALARGLTREAAIHRQTAAHLAPDMGYDG